MVTQGVADALVMQASAPLAVGIDLSVTATGIAHANGKCWLVGMKGITNLSVQDMLAATQNMALEIVYRAVSTTGCHTAVIEGLDMAQGYGAQIERTILWGKVIEGLMAAQVSVWVAPSGRVKMFATGKGSAKKGEVVEAVTRRWPHFEHNGDDNLADASAMAAMAAQIMDRPLSDLPATHMRALEGRVVRPVFEPPPPKVRKPR